MTLVRDILKKIDQMAPFSSAMSFDNSGLLVGNALQEVKKVLLALDITSEAVKKAKEIEAQLILSHHPVIFDPLKSLSSDHPVYHMAKWDIAAICAHTNLDVAEKGVNACLAQRLELKNVHSVLEENGFPIVLQGDLETALTSEELAFYIKRKLGCQAVAYTEGKDKISSLALCSGAGADYVLEAHCGAQGYLTGEVKHHQWIQAQERGITLLSAGHYATEVVVLQPLANELEKNFPDVEWVLLEDSAPEQYV